MKIRITEKDLVKVIKNIIKEQIETDSLNDHTADDLVLFADNTSSVYEYAKQHKNVGKVFNFTLKTYEKEFGKDSLKYDDLETLFYLFASKYEFPEED